MKKLLIVLSLSTLFFLLPHNARAQTPSAQINGTASTSAGAALGFDWGRLGWCLHPENGNIRCKTGNLATPPAMGGPPAIEPTTTVGFEVVSGTYFCATLVASTTDPRTELDCAAESATVSYSIWIDYKPQP